jgi:hypothetical protein
LTNCKTPTPETIAAVRAAADALAKFGTSELHPWLSRRIEEAEPFEVGDFTALLEEVAL